MNNRTRDKLIAVLCITIAFILLMWISSCSSPTQPEECNRLKIANWINQPIECIEEHEAEFKLIIKQDLDIRGILVQYRPQTNTMRFYFMGPDSVYRRYDGIYVDATQWRPVD